MSLTKYSYYISIASVFTWIGINILCHFIMFSIATFCCMITGNSFGAAVIYFVIHLVPIIISTTGNEFLANFVLGFSDTDYFTPAITFINPFTFLITVVGYISDIVRINYEYVSDNILKLIPIYLLASIVLYIVSYFLYKKRKLEDAEEVAGFKVMNYIFKYLITFTVAIVTIAVLSDFIYTSPIISIVTFILTTAVAYFISEMVLKKTLKVFGSYKGYAGFISVTVLVLIIIKITGCFGFEGHIPDVKEINEVSISSYYGYKHDAKISDKNVISLATKIHKEMIDGKALNKHDREYYSKLNIVYHMNNGKQIKREYCISSDEKEAILDRLYNYDEYVKNYDEFYSITSVYPYEIRDITITDSILSKDYPVDSDKINELYKAIEEDVLSLSYSQMYSVERTYKINLSIRYHVYDKSAYRTEYDTSAMRIINPYYKHTIEWLKKEGYLDLLSIPNDGKLYIRQGGYTEIKGVELLSDTIIIDDQAKVDTILDYIMENPTRNTTSDLVYTIYYNPVPETTSSVRELCEVNLRLMPDVFKKYI